MQPAARAKRSTKKNTRQKSSTYRARKTPLSLPAYGLAGRIVAMALAGRRVHRLVLKSMTRDALGRGELDQCVIDLLCDEFLPGEDPIGTAHDAQIPQEELVVAAYNALVCEASGEVAWRRAGQMPAALLITETVRHRFPAAETLTTLLERPPTEDVREWRLFVTDCFQRLYDAARDLMATPEIWAAVSLVADTIVQQDGAIKGPTIRRLLARSCLATPDQPITDLLVDF